jgi:hypothetical protein
MRKPIPAAVTTAMLAGLVAGAAPASACDPLRDTCTAVPSTSVSFVIGLGTLTITAAAAAPGVATAVLGNDGFTATIPLGTTTVKDTRSAATSWSMTATASDFTSAGARVGKDKAAFSVQPGWTAPAGSALPAFSLAPATTPQPADATGSRTLMTTVGSALNTGVTFTPVLTVTVPSGALAGTYTGTVTQSVS